MYTTHFKMTSQPFCERAPVEQILKDQRIEEGLARLQYFVEFSTIAMVTGPTGVGKSTLLKLFFHSLSSNRYRPVYLHFTNMKNTCLLKLIASGLGEKPRLSKERVLRQILEKTQKSEVETILVIDESHLLQSESLTDLRLLVSSALDETPPLRLLLVGQDGLKEELKRTKHNDLLQRINVRYQLHPLTKTQSIAYIDFQMNSVHASDKIFDSEVKSAVYDYTHGIPRQINNVASACLLNAAVQKAQKINLELFSQTMSEFQIN